MPDDDVYKKEDFCNKPFQQRFVNHLLNTYDSKINYLLQYICVYQHPDLYIFICWLQKKHKYRYGTFLIQ